MEYFLECFTQLFLILKYRSLSKSNFIQSSDIFLISPNLDTKPVTPSTTIYVSPPTLVEITGTPDEIASNADKPKLSFSEVSKNSVEFLSSL